MIKMSGRIKLVGRMAMIRFTGWSNLTLSWEEANATWDLWN